MRIREAHARRNLVSEAIGSAGPSLPGVDYNVLLCVFDDAGVEWFRQYYEHWGQRWNWASEGEIPATLDAPVLPWFESMADSGLLFFDATVAPICGPSRTGMQSGRYGFRHGHDINIRDPQTPVGTLSPANYKVPLSELFLAEYIKSERPDYATGHFSKWHMADNYSVQSPTDAYSSSVLAPDINLTHPALMGYDHSVSYPGNIGGNYTWWPITNGVVGAKIQGDATATWDETTYPTAVTGAAALSWINAQGNNPWFAYVAFGPPHSIFTCPPHTMLPSATVDELTGLGIVAGARATGTVRNNPLMDATWRASMQATDEGLRRIWDGMSAAVQARTILIVIGDNGTTSEALQTGFNHAKRQLYWGGTRVPMVIKGPMVANPGERVRSIVAGQDIFDTVTDLLRLPRAPSVRDSVSLVPLIRRTVDRTDPNALRDYVYTSLGSNNDMDGVDELWAIYDGRYRTGRMGGSDVIITDEEVDPFETTDYSDTLAAEKEEATAYKVQLVGY